ncbi:CIC11C00000004711 [Sungouiella intermedia]|uniref:CIC11C00000004711 n=1 Tax=Sungouiella intermedia TaxID=45354 RepID=A0A1L0BDV9_9ASCO|nr:CIC11C00000004711 [[Candida] intermedia]
MPPQQYIPQPGAPVAEAPTKIHTSANPGAAVSFTPTDVNIPTKLYNKIPNLDLYKKLQESEKQLDLLIAQKGLDFQSVQAASMQPHNVKRETGILRVFIYNTCENMPWQRQQTGGISDAANADAKWTLRVEGRFIASDKTGKEVEAQKFSSFLSGISVEIIPNGDYPNLQGSLSNIIEWRDESVNAGNPNSNFSNGSSQWLFDGIDIKRAGVYPIKTKIAILVKDYSSRLMLSTPMAQFTGKREASQQELVYLIWQYVLFKNLFKKADTFATVPAVSASNISSQSMDGQGEDENDLSVVQCDDILKALLKVDHFKFKDLYKHTQPHLRPRNPVVLEYEVDTTKSTTLGDVVLDIPVELPVSITKIQKEILEENKSAFESMSESDEHIQFLNQRISLGIATLQNINARELFYRELSEDPVKFLKLWLESQAETLKALKSEEGYNEEMVRRSEYFKEHEEELRQKIDLMLGAQKL